MARIDLLEVADDAITYVLDQQAWNGSFGLVDAEIEVMLATTHLTRTDIDQRLVLPTTVACLRAIIAAETR